MDCNSSRVHFDSNCPHFEKRILSNRVAFDWPGSALDPVNIADALDHAFLEGDQGHDPEIVDRRNA